MRLRILLCLWLVLVGCSQTPQQPPLDTVYDTAPDTWQIRAKLGIRAPDNTGSVTLNWQQTKDAYVLHLQAPLGQGSATIKGDTNTISIDRPGKEKVRSNSPDELIQQTFGWALSLDNLRYWVRGLEHPELPSEEIQRNELGLMTQLRQSGWDIRFSRYLPVQNTQNQNWLLPQKIRAENGDTTLTLIIKDWQF